MFSIARGARSSKAEDARPAAEAETIRREGIEAVARLTAEQPARLIEMQEANGARAKVPLVRKARRG